ncbi:hypothetical protein HPT29_028435 (plasmid) [Microvirga terrae]|uniref:Uncharacterized protein n=1 Tax=Microvirga terrae TaxID=2740529 RepID=A0ABY5S4K3_9HYPH|nr:hypothetical protein [Microvirga terrae]UVF22882.1 hypothetical protein HPT29_028435 [Microvirga terrae]
MATPSIAKGDRIEINGEDKAELEANLIAEADFSEEEASKIINEIVES